MASREKKKSLLSEDTFVANPAEELVIEKSATIYCSHPRRLAAHGKSKDLTRKAVGIGRDRQNSVIVADPKVSKFHAVLTFGEKAAYIKDTGSTNGTTVNGDSLTPNRNRELRDRDVVIVGTTEIRIRY
jgi:3D (Asp-Asp-Asp) domain-containing protein